MLVRPTSRQRGTFVRSVAAASIAIAATLPQVLNAQQAQQPAPASDTSKTHTVKRGDTLWDIAKVIPRRLVPVARGVSPQHRRDRGSALDLSRRAAASCPAITRRSSRWPSRAGNAGRFVGDSCDVTAGDERRAKLPMERRCRAILGPPTRSCRPSCTTRRRRCCRLACHGGARAGEYIAAPWVDRDGGPRNPGLLIESADIPGIASHQKSRLQLHDRVFIAPPSGSMPAQHALFLTYRLGPYLEDFGQIVIPTGIVEVSQPGSTGEASVGQRREDVRRSEAGAEAGHARQRLGQRRRPSGRDHERPHGARALGARLAGAPEPAELRRHRHLGPRRSHDRRRDSDPTSRASGRTTPTT